MFQLIRKARGQLARGAGHPQNLAPVLSLDGDAACRLSLCVHLQIACGLDVEITPARLGQAQRDQARLRAAILDSVAVPCAVKAQRDIGAQCIQCARKATRRVDPVAEGAVWRKTFGRKGDTVAASAAIWGGGGLLAIRAKPFGGHPQRAGRGGISVAACDLDGIGHHADTVQRQIRARP